MVRSRVKSGARLIKLAPLCLWRLTLIIPSFGRLLTGGHVLGEAAPQYAAVGAAVPVRCVAVKGPYLTGYEDPRKERGGWVRAIAVLPVVALADADPDLGLAAG